MFKWNWAELVTTKVFWASILIIIGTIGASVMGEVAWGASFIIIIEAILAIFFRDAIAKKM